MFAIMLFGVFLVLAIIFIKPKWGSLLIWPILFTYPHSWWFYRGFLPLNIGVDDLFCIFLFLVVVVRRNFIEGIPVRFGYAYWTISFFVLIASIANYCGALDTISAYRIVYFKDIMKLLVYWGLFYAILHCIDDIHDLKIQFTFFTMAAVLGAFIVTLQSYFPFQMEIFAAPDVLETRGLTYEGRAAGAFMNPNSAACVLVCATILMSAAITLQRTVYAKFLVYGMTFFLLTAIMVTRSRTGFFTIVITLVLMALLDHNRSVKNIARLTIVAGIMVALFFSGIRLMFQERIEVTYSAEAGWGANVLGRIDSWRSYFDTATTRDYFLGQGRLGGVNKNGIESHSAYVSFITVYGLGGVIWAIVTPILYFRKSWQLRKLPDRLVSAISSGGAWAIVAWGIYALAADAISAQYPRYILFYLIVLLDRTVWIAEHTVPEEEYSGTPLALDHDEHLPVGTSSHVIAS